MKRLSEGVPRVGSPFAWNSLISQASFVATSQSGELRGHESAVQS